MRRAYREDIPYSEIPAPATTEADRAAYWETGAGLQAVDALEVSPYAEERAEQYVEGALSAVELERDLAAYHSRVPERAESREADIVAARIAGILETGGFTLRPAFLFAIHSSLFQSVLDRRWVGRARTVDIQKAEPVLGGRSVAYAPHGMIAAQLDYDFDQERAFCYKSPIDRAQLRHFTGFISNVWQTHAFREGNTRTIAVFSALYLRKLGIEVSNQPFIENSRLFRDALVRANFSDIGLGIAEDHSFIERFYENVALGANHVFDLNELNVHGIRVEEGLAYRSGADGDPSEPMTQRHANLEELAGAAHVVFYETVANAGESNTLEDPVI